MGYAPKKIRPSWEDRFRRPSFQDLREDLHEPMGGLVDFARERLASVPGVVEELAWQGVPWRWTLLYRLGSDPAHAWAYLVPDPTAPKFVMPIARSVVDALPWNRLKKHVRDGVTQGRLVNNVYWATWDLASKTQLAELLAVAEQTRKILAARN
ncbi:MAG: hypothetical protein SFZ24_04910 [Planctomycetota bacterium]|nr:hypothetical protein [Planctomycetota bacterium]